MRSLKQRIDGYSLITLILALAAIGAIGAVGWYVWDRQKAEQKPAITNFDECVAAGNPVMESYPEQCAANGQTFVRELSDEESVVPMAESKSDLITELGDEDIIELVNIMDLKNISQNFPESFQIYIRKILLSNNTPDEYGCLKYFSVRRISDINISGGASSIAPNGDRDGPCGLGGAAAYWYLKDGIWDILLLQDSPRCEELKNTTLFREFVPNCYDPTTDSLKANPNGSIEDADI